MTLSDLELLFHASRAISAVAELLVRNTQTWPLVGSTTKEIYFCWWKSVDVQLREKLVDNNMQCVLQVRASKMTLH